MLADRSPEQQAAITPVRSQTLDRWGNALSVTDPNGNVTTYRYDEASKLIEQKSAAVDVWAANGTSSVAQALSRNYYDKLGRAIGTIDPNGNANTARYDAAGQLVAEYHADGGVVQNIYDVLGRRTSGDKVKEVNGNNDSAAWSYDYFGRSTAHTDLGGATYTYAYNLAGQLTQQSNSWGMNQSFDYYENGALKQLNDLAQNAQTVFARDLPLSRLAR